MFMDVYSMHMSLKCHIKTKFILLVALSTRMHHSLSREEPLHSPWELQMVHKAVDVQNRLELHSSPWVVLNEVELHSSVKGLNIRSPGALQKGVLPYSSGPGALQKGVLPYSSGPGALQKGVLLHSSGPGALQKGVLLYSSGPGALQKGVLLYSSGPGALQKGVLLHSLEILQGTSHNSGLKSLVL